MSKRYVCFTLSLIFISSQLFLEGLTSPLTSRLIKTKQKFIKTSLAFEINKGQLKENIKFRTRGAKGVLYLTKNEAVFDLGKSDLRMKLLNANDVKPIGKNKLKGKVTYRIGKDKNKWHENIPLFGKVEYKNIYKGINLVCYGKNEVLEYDFVVSPKSNPDEIVLDFDNANEILVNKDGNLELNTSGSKILFKKPFAYQEFNGVKKEVKCNYLAINDRVKFSLGNYDKSKKLIIDPEAIFSTFLGGEGQDVPAGIDVDSDGNLYITGQTNSSSLAGQITEISSDYNDSFLVKLDSDGNLLSALIFGGVGVDSAKDIVIDSSNNAYIVGLTTSDDFPTTEGALESASGSTDTFVVKVNSSNSFEYAALIGTTSDTSGQTLGRAIAIDDSGDAYITGEVQHDDFSIIEPALQSSRAGAGDAFVCKLKSDGTRLLYSTYLGGSNNDSGYDIEVDSSGNAYIAGITRSDDFTLTSDALFPEEGDSNNNFITKIRDGGDLILYSTYFPGSYTLKIEVDSDENIYIAKTVPQDEEDDLETSTLAYQTTHNGSNDGYLAKIDSSGSLVFATYLGGGSSDGIYDLDIDENGNSYVTGSTSNSVTTETNDFPITEGTERGIGKYAFISKINNTGTKLEDSFYVSEEVSSTDIGAKIKVVGSGSKSNIFVQGYTSEPDFEVVNAFQSTIGGDIDVFLAKFENTTTSSLFSTINLTDINKIIQGIKKEVKEISKDITKAGVSKGSSNNLLDSFNGFSKGSKQKGGTKTRTRKKEEENINPEQILFLANKFNSEVRNLNSISCANKPSSSDVVEDDTKGIEVGGGIEGPTATGTMTGPTVTGAMGEPIATGTMTGPTATGTMIGPGITGTMTGPTATGTMVGPTVTGTMGGPIATGTMTGPTTTGTMLGPTTTMTGPTTTMTGPTATGTMAGPTVTGTMTGPTATGTMTGPTTGTMLGPTTTGTMLGPITTGTISGPISMAIMFGRVASMSIPAGTAMANNPGCIDDDKLQEFFSNVQPEIENIFEIITSSLSLSSSSSCTSDKDCAFGETCSSSKCTKKGECGADSDCSGGKVCSSTTLSCVDSKTSKCAHDKDCKDFHLKCDIESGACILKNTTTCFEDKDCQGTNQVCNILLGLCEEKIPASCMSDNDCNANDRACNLELGICAYK